MEATGQDEVSNHPPLQGLKTCVTNVAAKTIGSATMETNTWTLSAHSLPTVRWKLRREVPLPMQVPMQGSKGLIC